MSQNNAHFKKVAILGGGGLMGHGIALSCLQRSDAQVTIISRRDETVKHGIDLIENGQYGLGRAVKRGKLTEDARDEIRSRLSGTTDYAEGLAGADLVFETIPEVADLKHKALLEAEKHASE